MNQLLPTNTDPTAIARTIDYFKSPTQVVELRARSTEHGIIRGLFNDAKTLAKYAAKLSEMPDVESVNMTMQTLDPALDVDNIAYFHARRACSTENVTHLRYLMVDIDPAHGERPATPAEIKDCLDAMQTIQRYLVSKGWPEAAIAVSGNGVHGFYLVDYMCRDQISVEIFHTCLRALAAKFDTEDIHIDLAAARPTTMPRVYGAMNRKFGGDGVASYWVSIPTRQSAVTRRQLCALGDTAPGERLSKDRFRPTEHTACLLDDEDVEELLDHYGLPVKHREERGDETWWHLEECPMKGGLHLKQECKTSIYLSPQFGLQFRCLAGACDEYRIGDLLRYLNESQDPYPYQIWEEPDITTLYHLWDGLDDLSLQRESELSRIGA
jgi:hypothetical protein